jgi:putative transposase
VKTHQAAHRIATVCRVLGVSPSGYYAWQSRPRSARAQADAALTQQIGTIHARSRETYGAPRVHAELAAQGTPVGRKRVARLMQAAGLAGVSRRPFVTTTRRDPRARPAPDLVRRAFTADGPNQLWVADITYIATWAGFLYLAVVLDAWSRRVVGWAMATHLRTELVLDALNMAVTQRRPTHVIHHSDQGCQGGFNWSSQHLTTEVLYGKATWVDSDADRPAGDVVAGPTAGAARCGAEVLGEDRRGTVERGGGDRVWGVRPRWCSLVPRAGWHAVDPAHPAVGPVPIVR